MLDPLGEKMLTIIKFVPALAVVETTTTFGAVSVPLKLEDVIAS